MAATLKSLVRKLIPQRYRLLRYELYERGRYYPELIFSLGNRLQCPFCQWQFRRFRPAGFDYPVLNEKRVVGASYHPDVVCPRCLSNERERLLYLYLKNRTSLFTDRLRLLHIAPEPNLKKVLQSCPGIQYISADLADPLAMMNMDITRVPFRGDVFDVIICNHVLEHVPDDRLAMSELHRVLRPGGWAILQVPIALALDDTFEDATATTEAERIRLFGQRDHVRLYASADYTARLQSVGFSINICSYADELGEEAIRRYSLVRDEKIYICAKPKPLS
jgi:SAM-dependent methyltransferase